MDLTWIEKHLAARSSRASVTKLRERVASASASVDEGVRNVQRICSELHPSILDDLGLAAAVEWQAQEFQNRTGIRCRFDSEMETIDMERDRATALFRIFQEVLTNVARHAKATRVRIRLDRQDGELVLVVQDNGKGIKPSDISSPKSLGLLGMRERASLVGASLTIRGAPAKGTKVTLAVPLETGWEKTEIP